MHKIYCIYRIPGLHLAHHSGNISFRTSMKLTTAKLGGKIVLCFINLIETICITQPLEKSI